MASERGTRPVREVWVLWDEGSERPRPGSKTHAKDCHMFPTFHWAKGEYRLVAAREIPGEVAPRGFCGGGRPDPSSGTRAKGGTPLRKTATPPGPIAEPLPGTVVL